MSSESLRINSWGQYFQVKTQLLLSLISFGIIKTDNKDPFRFNGQYRFLKIPRIYCQLRDVQSFPEIEAMEAALLVWKFNSSVNRADLITSVPEEANGLTALISSTAYLNLPRITLRKPKDHGQSTVGNIDGRFNPNEKVILIEGTTTQGQSILKTCKRLEEVGLKILKIFSIISYDCGVDFTFLQEEYMPESLFNIKDDILPALKNTGKIDIHRFDEEIEFWTEMNRLFSIRPIDPKIAQACGLLSPLYQFE